MSQYYFTLKGLWKRIKEEYRYASKKSWTLEEVGNFWDTVEEYDAVNEQLYTYFRRFSNSYELAKKYLKKNKYRLLDIQSRSGKGSLFWYEKKNIKEAVCVDFSDHLLSLAENRLKNCGLDYKIVKVKEFPLPFEDKEFGLICTYETIEHIYDYKWFIEEITRILEVNGILILTCPNRAWNWVHWLSTVININHSEGPRRFLSRKELIATFKENNMRILEENSTIFMPFNNQYSIVLDKLIEKYLPRPIKRLIALRRTFILQKPDIKVITVKEETSLQPILQHENK